MAVSDYLVTLMFNAEYEKGVPLAEKVIQRFPHDDILKSHLAFMYINWKGDLSRARALLNEMAPHAGFEYVSLATQLPLYERNLSGALSTWDLPEVVKYSGYRSSPSGWRGRELGEIHQLLGNHDVATEVFNEFIADESANDGWAARILALVGQRDLAIQEIERLIDTLCYTLTRWNLTLDSRWDFFRDDERFNDLVHPVNDP